MNVYTRLHAVLIPQTAFKDGENELIVFPLQRLCSFYLKWQFLVKLVEYVNPSIRNALSHLGLCVFFVFFARVKPTGNEAGGLYCENVPPVAFSFCQRGRVLSQNVPFFSFFIIFSHLIFVFLSSCSSLKV